MKNTTLLHRIYFGIKSGWSLPIYPAHILEIDSSIYLRIFKALGALCTFMLVSGIIKQFDYILFLITIIISISYLIYRLLLVFYALKQFIIHIIIGKLLVINSPLGFLSSIFRVVSSSVKTTTSITVGTGITYCLASELGEILAILFFALIFTFYPLYLTCYNVKYLIIVLKSNEFYIRKKPKNKFSRLGAIALSTIFPFYFNNLPSQYLDSPVLKEVFSQSYKDTKGYIHTHFKPYSQADKEMLISNLQEFKNKVDTIRLNDANLESFKASFSIFRDKNLVLDQRLIDFKNRMLNFQEKAGLNLDSKDIGLADLKNTSQFLKDNKEEVASVLAEIKPLGPAGDVTLNQLINMGTEALIPILDIIHPTIGIEGGLGILSTIFFYRVVVNLYTKAAHGMDLTGMTPENIKLFRADAPRNIRLFMLLGAPLITASLVTIAKLNPINININLSAEVKEAVTSAANILPFLTKNKPAYFKSFFTITFSLVLMAIVNNYGGFNFIGILLANPFYYKLLKIYFIFGSILILFVIIYYMLTIYFFIQFSKGKISMPIYLPQFILSWLTGIQKLSKIPAKSTIIDYYLRFIIIYALIFVYLVLFLLFIY